MIAKRSSPWIHRWSRPLSAAIASIGAVETAYLTWVKLTGNSAACPTQGCEQVLNSPYASIFGLPLTLFGLLAYLSIGILAIAPLLIDPHTQKSLRSNVEEQTRLLMFALSTAMVVFSGYLMQIMVFEIQEFCPYCVASALFALSLFILSIWGHDWQDPGQLLLTGLTIGMVTLIGVLGIYGSINSSQTSLSSGNSSDPYEIATTSGPAELELARHLQQIGAKEYGAYWCPHCKDQKLLFGKEAFAMIDYVECDPKGKNARASLCQEAGITGYPTWEINGQFYPGILSLEKLADLSGYQGQRNFKY
ncbi:vitamin K epoxide reductase family protein [Limnoraphis robusta Tam1]|uniref:vitamin K epoxide reductase family protein n=1 Tax=Limnoraphis robusta TaxID=1118279 RepID=UPI002B218699|nr:vitamin K epoxide reductase family protein [Limnoraphis robusta]MEA5538641.1 vitamin K epoxide reductase family protein [Limnoraphis robusta Tam1]